MQPRNLPMKLLIGVVVLLMPLGASAENLSLDPEEVQFGDVQVGQSATQIVTLTSTDDNDLVIYAIMIWDDSSESFEIISELPTFPYAMAQDETLDVEVTFTPAFEAYLEGIFIIVSNAIPPNDFLEVMVSGTGVPFEPPVSVSVAEILAFFDASVADGTLVGDGPGNSASGRLKALRNMIDASGDLIEQGALEQACQQLWDAYERCDGVPKPPEFVAGEAAPVLNGMIGQLLAEWSCP